MRRTEVVLYPKIAPNFQPRSLGIEWGCQILNLLACLETFQTDTQGLIAL